MTDIVLFPPRHWHLVCVTSDPTNCISFLAADALYSLFFSMILIIICSLILRPRLLLCFQVMYSITEWFIGEERGKGEGKALRGKMAKFQDFWLSEIVPKFLGVLEVFLYMMKALGFCIVCFILQYFMILIYSELCWFVTSFHHYPGRNFLWKHRKETTPWCETLQMSNCHQTMDSVIYPVLAEYLWLQYLITSQNDKVKIRASLSPFLRFPFTSCISSAGYCIAGKRHSLSQPEKKAPWLKR